MGALHEDGRGLVQEQEVGPEPFRGVSGERHGAACADVLFERPCAAAGSEVALEDYARALTRAESATALAGDEAGSVRGVHLCSLPGPLEKRAGEDIEAFARELAGRSGGGLGWS
jgi:hypothetical protein